MPLTYEFNSTVQLLLACWPQELEAGITYIGDMLFARTEACLPYPQGSFCYILSWLLAVLQNSTEKSSRPTPPHPTSSYPTEL